MKVLLCDYCKQTNAELLGLTVYLPKGRGTKHVDNQSVLKACKEGKSIREVAKQFGLTGRRVYRILARSK